MSESLKELASIAGWMKNEIALTERRERAGLDLGRDWWPREDLAKEGLRLAMRALPGAYVIGQADEFSVCYFLEILANVLFRHGYEVHLDGGGSRRITEVWGEEGLPPAV